MERVPILLASTSPRRVDLLSQVHLPIQVQAPQADETPQKKEKPDRLVMRLSQEKAKSVRPIAIKRYASSLILAADTIVVAPQGSRILGKPKDTEDAIKMLRLLQGKTHIVLTGYCALRVSRKQIDRQVVRVIRSKVKMRSLSQKTIERYVASQEPMDKAGAYAAQGLGMALIERIEGSYTNVVGLPIAQVLMDLEKVFKIPLFSWTS